MASELAALDPKELILVVIAFVGLVPVLLLSSSRSKLFTGGYVLLCVGAVVTNLEAVVLGDVLNVVEHAVGIAAAGVVFFVAAYTRRRRVLAEGE
ncbi:hypothetical protein [Halopelagius fulvigenes]|uniref:DUF2198 family protein n=1 Tax=Halopelagius fulvigenes TaxID=1198324 RepID=A0ABD5U309_9EURY